MAFIKSSEQRERKVFPNKYVRLDEDKPVMIQILQEEAIDYYKFWTKDSTGKSFAYVSPGYNVCPLTQRNITVGKDSKQYIRASHKYAVSVLDITPVVKCSECETAHRPDTLSADSENMCGNCSTSLDGIEPAPYNEVRILERGVQLFGQLSGLAGDAEKGIPPQVLNSSGDPLGITEYPLTIIRTGTSRNTNYTVVPHADHPLAVDPVDFEDKLLELPDMGFNFTPEEVLSLVDDGVPVSEILSAREGEEYTPTAVSTDDKDTLY